MQTIKNIASSIASLISKKVIFWLIGLLSFKVVLILFAFFIILMAIIGGGVSDVDTGDKSNNNGLAVCSPTGEVNMEVLDLKLENAGVFKNKSDLFISTAEEWGVDPILLAAIAMLETGWGKSDAVVLKNNPGGLKINGVTHHFETLEAGMRSMGKTLNTQVIKNGRTDLEVLGAHYAPVGDSDDVNKTNPYWAENVRSIAQGFGGFTMNCESVGGGDILAEGIEGEFIMPTTGRLSSGFGWRELYVMGVLEKRLHAGTDIANPTGTPIWASANGVIRKTHTGCVVGDKYCGGGWGNHIIIQHNINGTLYETIYAHLSSVDVALGKEVIGGEAIGKMGTTGSSTGPHLHFELHPNGYRNPIDPYPLLKNK